MQGQGIWDTFLHADERNPVLTGQGAGVVFVEGVGALEYFVPFYGNSFRVEYDVVASVDIGVGPRSGLIFNSIYTCLQ